MNLTKADMRNLFSLNCSIISDGNTTSYKPQSPAHNKTTIKASCYMFIVIVTPYMFIVIWTHTENKSSFVISRDILIIILSIKRKLESRTQIKDDL